MFVRSAHMSRRKLFARFHGIPLWLCAPDLIAWVREGPRRDAVTHKEPPRGPSTYVLEICKRCVLWGRNGWVWSGKERAIGPESM
uniref:Transposase n=1 Tax=Steinernema glaseri TaxID=37863 RepID=A0A1I7XW11_9BILA